MESPDWISYDVTVVTIKSESHPYDHRDIGGIYVNIEFVRVTFISEFDFASCTVNNDEIDKWPVSLLQTL